MSTDQPAPTQTSETTSKSKRSPWLWRIAVIIAVPLLIAGNVAVWVNLDILNTSNFVTTTTDVLQEPEVRDALAVRIVDRLFENFPALSQRPLLKQAAGNAMQSIVSGLLDTEALDEVVTRIATQLHQIIVKGERPSVTIESPILQGVVIAVARQVAPDQAADLQASSEGLTIEIFKGDIVPSYENEINIIRWVGLIAGILGIVLLVLPFIMVRDRWSVRLAGFGLVAVGVLSWLGVALLRLVENQRVDDANADTVLDALVSAFTRGLVVQSAIIMLAGVVLCVYGFALWPFQQRDAQPATTDQPATA